MYKITCDDYILHDPAIQSLKVINAKCGLEVNKTGSLTFKVPPTHPYYDEIHKHTSIVTLYQDDEMIFRGRVLNDEIDFYNVKNIECEGELAYLIDSIQRYNEYHIQGTSSNNAIKSYLKSLIEIHNNQVSEDRKRFTLGVVSVVDSNNYLYKQTNYESTLDVINADLLKTYGGYLLIRHSEGINYLDYVSEYSGTCTQTIEFGKNIVDMTRYIKGEDIFTALIPLGTTLDQEGSEKRKVNISTIPDETDGTIVKVSDYIYDTEAVKQWGWIWKAVTWDDVTVDNNLLTKAKSLLKASVNEIFMLEMTAIDLHLLDIDIDRIRIGNKIRCISKPHNLDAIMFVKSMTIDLDNPANTKIQLTLPESQNSISSTKQSITTNQTNTNKTVQQFQAAIDEGYATKQDISSTKDWVSDNYVSKYDDDDKIVDYADKQWVKDNCAPILDGNNNAIDYADKNWVSDNYLSKTGNGSINLSEYAKISDVNAAFDELASALSEV